MRTISALVTAVACATAAVALVAGCATTSTPLPGSQASTTPHHEGATARVVDTFRLPADGLPTGSPNATDYAERTEASGPLLLFLPATRAVPSHYRTFYRTAVDSGYHVLGLDYWNVGRSLAKTCELNSACYASLQHNRFDGYRPGRFSDVPADGGILHRTKAALKIAASNDPGGDWSHYLDDGGLRWSDIVVAGHSQGGGEAAFIAHLHELRGALLFSSPVEYDQGVTAPWMLASGETSPQRIYGFDDSGDVYASRITGSWRVLGLPRSHRIVTDAALGSPGQAHDRSVSDNTPRSADGVPIFEDSWKWMLGQVHGQAPHDLHTRDA